MSSSDSAHWSASGTAPADLTRPRAWICAVLVLAFCHAQAIASVHVLNILVDPIKTSLRLSDTQFSILQGVALAVFAVILGLPAARVADRRSRRRVILAGVLIWSVGSLLSASVSSFAQLLVARALVGIGEIVLFPAALSMLYDLSPPRRLATSIGLFGAGGPIGAALAMIGGGWLMSVANEAGLVSLGPVSAEAWRVALAACGVMGAIAALGVLAIAEPARHGAHQHRTLKAAPLLECLRRAWPAYLTISGGFVLLSTAVFAVNAWVPTYLVRVHSFSYEAAGRLTGMAAIVCAVVGAWIAGISVDWLHQKGRRDAALIASVAAAVILASSIIAAVHASTVIWMSAFLCITYFSLGMPTVLGGTALQQISPAHLRAQIMAAHVLLVNALALSLGPTSVALLTDRIFHTPIAVGYSIAIVAASAATLAAIAHFMARRSFVWTRDQLEVSGS